jgi:glycine oxidase
VVHVIVIGAGVIGVSIAEALASRDVGVTVFDMRSPGRGASQASAGLLTPFIEGRTDPALLDLCKRSLGLWDGFIARLRDRTTMPVEFARTGTLEVALTEDEASGLVHMRQWVSDQGVENEWFDADEVVRFEPTLNESALAGLFIPCQGFVAASPLVKALTHAARLQGAQFESPVEAVRVASSAEHVDVYVDGDRRSADVAVVAAGTWSGRVRIDGVARLPVKPMRGQLLHLKWSGGRLPRHPVWGAHSYTVPWQPDTLLVGATLEDVGFDERSTVAGVQELLDGVSELLPMSKLATLLEVRAGLRPSTVDLLPIVGALRSQPRVVVATGHYRNGILLAPLTAQMVVRQILDGVDDPAIQMTTPERFYAEQRA